MRVQETVKKESLQIAVQSGIATLIMWICIFILHHFIPEKVSFDYRVILSGLLGTVVAVMNFLLMGITVQSVLSVENQEEAYQRMRLSYRKRTMLQLGWIILAIVAPCFQAVPGIIP
ncbi:MAG: ATP synthase subunit I, partial [Oribacterium parvum]|nr:ATP synthase subunit I [Oribacterium parvum]